MRYTPLATDAHGGLGPMPYALCPMPYALCPREHLMLLRKAISSRENQLGRTGKTRLATRQTSQKGEFGSVCRISKSPYKGKSSGFACSLPIKSHFFSQLFS